MSRVPLSPSTISLRIDRGILLFYTWPCLDINYWLYYMDQRALIYPLKSLRIQWSWFFKVTILAPKRSRYRIVQYISPRLRTYVYKRYFVQVDCWPIVSRPTYSIIPLAVIGICSPSRSVLRNSSYRTSQRCLEFHAQVQIENVIMQILPPATTQCKLVGIS